MSVVDSARFMALAAIGINDGIIAVLDAKYHYNFWRPITAIRNGDIDGNPATDREATWQPIVCRTWHRSRLRGTGSFCARNESRSQLMFALTRSSGAMSCLPSCFFCWSVEPCSSPPFSR
jgi:hypothetical protein